MPTFPPTNTTPYDTAYAILNAAKSRLNQQIPSLAATSPKLLDNTQAFTQQAFNNASRRMQNVLANLGWSGVTREALIIGLPQVQTADPGVQVFINWANYFDGQFYWTQPVLPADMITPLKVWERWSGVKMPFPQDPMELMLDGLPDWGPKQTWNAICDWRSDGLYMPGSLQVMDLRLRYLGFIPDMVDVGDSRWFQQKYPIYNCMDALSRFIVIEISESRSDIQVDIQAMKNEAEGATKFIFNRDQRLRQRVTATRQPLSGRGRHSGWCG